MDKAQECRAAMYSNAAIIIKTNTGSGLKAEYSRAEISNSFLIVAFK
jgi:hypothetical protein